MSKPKLSFEYLKEEDKPQLIAHIQSVMNENDAHNKEAFSAEYWQWNYRQLEEGESIIYVAKNEKNELVGHYHFIILDGHYPKGGKTKYTLIQDAGVHPDYRNLGIFKTLSLMGKADLKEKGVKIIETFPNIRSKHSFSKNTQYTIINIMPSFIQPYDLGYLINSKIPLGFLGKWMGKLIQKSNSLRVRKFQDSKAKIEVSKNFDEEILEVYREFAQTYTFGLVKNANYLQWRFVEKPAFNHYFVKIRDGQGMVQAMAVVKEDVLMGVDILALIDMAYRPGSERYFLQLLDLLRKNHGDYFKTPIALLYTTINGKISSELGKAGLIKIPPKLNPRVIPLMVSNTEEIEGFYDHRNWQVCLCDWDVL